MGLFGIFGKKEQSAPSWTNVAGQLSSMLWHFLQTDPELLASPYSRVVLRKDWSVVIANDKRDPDRLIGSEDLSFVFFREESAAL